MKFTLYPPQAIYEIGQRQNQEDAIFPKIGEATNRDRLFIFCDGMGGHEKGEVASNTISQALAAYLDKNASTDAVVSDDVLLAALEYAYQQIDAKDDGAAKKMGTTLCLLIFHRGGVTAMHIGDSRIYHIRPSEHRVVYQSKDHSLVYDLYQAGEITYDEMRTSPQKNIITRAIQPGKDNRVRPSIVHIVDIQPGDYFYICSDGMLEQMENDELCKLISTISTDKKKRQQLINATVSNKDNHSAYIIHIEKVVRGQGDENLLDDEQTSPDNAINIKPRIEVKEDVAEEDDVEIVEGPPSDVVTVQSPMTPRGTRTNGKKYLIALIGAVALLVIVFLAVKAFLPNKHEQTEVIGIEKVAPPKQARPKAKPEVATKPQVKPSDEDKAKANENKGKNTDAKKVKEKDGKGNNTDAGKQVEEGKSNAQKMVDKLKNAKQKQNEEKTTKQTKGKQD